MIATASTDTAARPCPGCLGSRTCSVCVGTGRADVERSLGDCRRCDGTGTCALCPPPRPRDARP